MSDIISPFAYCALPFVNQAFFVAGCCYVKGVPLLLDFRNQAQQGSTEIESIRSSPSTPVTSPRRAPASLTITPGERSKPDSTTEGRDAKQVDLSRALLTSVATTNISTLQQGLAKQNIYWSGTAWISSALSQRIEGIQDVDLVGVTEKLASFVSLPDAGLVGGTSTEEDGSSTAVATPAFDLSGMTPAIADRPMYDFSEFGVETELELSMLMVIYR